MSTREPLFYKGFLMLATVQEVRIGASRMDGLSGEELDGFLNELARDLKDLYGERYRGLVLYGSYTRGEADEGSDVDVLLLLEDSVAMGREIVRIEPVVWRISLKAGYTFYVLPVGVQDYLEPREPSFANARREGVLVA